MPFKEEGKGRTSEKQKQPREKVWTWNQSAQLFLKKETLTEAANLAYGKYI